MDLTNIKRIETTGSVAVVNQRIKDGGYLVAAVYKVSYIEYHLGFTVSEQDSPQSNQDGNEQPHNHLSEHLQSQRGEPSNPNQDTSEAIQGRLSQPPI